MTSPRPVRLCDYRGYACQCDGYRPAEPGTTRCVCGHARSQHHAADPPPDPPEENPDFSRDRACKHTGGGIV